MAVNTTTEPATTALNTTAPGTTSTPTSSASATSAAGPSTPAPQTTVDPRASTTGEPQTTSQSPTTTPSPTETSTRGDLVSRVERFALDLETNRLLLWFSSPPAPPLEARGLLLVAGGGSRGGPAVVRLAARPVVPVANSTELLIDLTLREAGTLKLAGAAGENVRLVIESVFGAGVQANLAGLQQFMPAFRPDRVGPALTMAKYRMAARQLELLFDDALLPSSVVGSELVVSNERRQLYRPGQFTLELMGALDGMVAIQLSDADHARLLKILAGAATPSIAVSPLVASDPAFNRVQAVFAAPVQVVAPVTDDDQAVNSELLRRVVPGAVIAVALVILALHVHAKRARSRRLAAMAEYELQLEQEYEVGLMPRPSSLRRPHRTLQLDRSVSFDDPVAEVTARSTFSDTPPPQYHSAARRSLDAALSTASSDILPAPPLASASSSTSASASSVYSEAPDYAANLTQPPDPDDQRRTFVELELDSLA